MIPLIVLLVVVLVPVIWVAVQYNWLVSLRNYISESWSNVDTELKRRYDLIPNLVATVKGYAAHEREVLERVTQLRERCVANNGSPGEQARDEVQLVDALKQLLVIVESYPQLKADQPVVLHDGPEDRDEHDDEENDESRHGQVWLKR